MSAEPGREGHFRVVTARMPRTRARAETPFEQATKLELVLNLKAARRLGVVVPSSVRVAADEVIE